MESTSSAASKRPYFTAANESGLAALASPRTAVLRHYHQMGYHYLSSPRSAASRIYDARFEQPQPHFLDSCFLCNKPLANKDIFMYRGDVPFCSEDCRHEQIEMDEAEEKSMNLSSSVRALREKEQKRSTSPNKRQDYSLRPGTVNAAA